MYQERHDGYSLLEVILALAILGGAIAVLGEAARYALVNAQAVRQAARAQLICESKMSEILAGLTPAEDDQGEAVAALGPDEPAWLYCIETDMLDEENDLLAVRVTVSQDLPTNKHPAKFSLTRWVSNAAALSANTYGENTAQGVNSGSTAGGSTQ